MAFIPKDYQRFRIDGQNIIPQYIKATPSIVATVDQLIDCFRFAVGESYGSLRDSYEPLCMESQRHRLIRGIIHLLESRLQFEAPADADIVGLRMKIFERAAQIDGNAFVNRSKWRDDLLDEFASESQMSLLSKTPMPTKSSHITTYPWQNRFSCMLVPSSSPSFSIRQRRRASESSFNV